MADNMSLSVWVIVLTLFLSMVLAIINLPDFVPVELGFLRPEWVTLVLIYWLITLPNRVGIIIAWVVGMLTKTSLIARVVYHCLPQPSA